MNDDSTIAKDGFGFIMHKMFADDTMLRDFFAGLAMHQMLQTEQQATLREIAKEAFDMADTMMRAREKK